MRVSTICTPIMTIILMINVMTYFFKNIMRPPGQTAYNDKYSDSFHDLKKTKIMINIMMFVMEKPKFIINDLYND